MIAYARDTYRTQLLDVVSEVLVVFLNLVTQYIE